MKKATKQVAFLVILLRSYILLCKVIFACGKTSPADMPPAAWKRGARSVSEAVVG